LVVNVVVVGPFEEEEEGIGITSDVAKVKGEDPGTPQVRIRRDVGDFESLVCSPGLLVMIPRDHNDSPRSVS